jgi:hypothetical protein
MYLSQPILLAAVTRQQKAIRGQSSYERRRIRGAAARSSRQWRGRACSAQLAASGLIDAIEALEDVCFDLVLWSGFVKKALTCF